MNLFDIIPTIFDWKSEKLTIDIFADIVFDFDFVVGDCCDHGKDSNSDWKKCKEKNEFIFQTMFFPLNSNIPLDFKQMSRNTDFTQSNDSLT